jgi:hypothetical protein
MTTEPTPHSEGTAATDADRAMLESIERCLFSDADPELACKCLELVAQFRAHSYAAGVEAGRRRIEELEASRERILQSYEYCVRRSLEHIADKKPTLAVCVLEVCDKSLKEARAALSK